MRIPEHIEPEPLEIRKSLETIPIRFQNNQFTRIIAAFAGGVQSGHGYISRDLLFTFLFQNGLMADIQIPLYGLYPVPTNSGHAGKEAHPFYLFLFSYEVCE